MAIVAGMASDCIARIGALFALVQVAAAASFALQTSGTSFSNDSFRDTNSVVVAKLFLRAEDICARICWQDTETVLANLWIRTGNAFA